LQNQVSNLGRELETERKKNESLSFKMVAREEELRKVKDSNNSHFNN
jgi:hypothetical protein